jgi:hypothetical protein
MATCKAKIRYGTTRWGQSCGRAAGEDGLCGSHRGVRNRQQRQRAYWANENATFAAAADPTPPEYSRETYEARIAERLAEKRARR